MDYNSRTLASILCGKVNKAFRDKSGVAGDHGRAIIPAYSLSIQDSCFLLLLRFFTLKNIHIIRHHRSEYALS